MSAISSSSAGLKTNNLLLSGLTIYSEKKLYQQAALLIENGKISAIFDQSQQLPDHPHHLQFEGQQLIPGIIDLFAHGAAGSDVMDATPQALTSLTQALPHEGVTSFLAATMTQSYDRIEKALLNVKDFVANPYNGAEILGIYLEGPFLSAEKCGVQSADKLANPDLLAFKHWQQLSGNLIRLAAIAPELPQAIEFIDYLQQQQVIASIAHTNASYQQTVDALDAGCRHATHFFNAMSGMNHKAPGRL